MDTASDVIDQVRRSMMLAWDGDTDVPPTGQPVAQVYLVAGDAVPLAMWNAHNDGDCVNPFAWVRLARRYRSRQFPSQTLDSSCTAPVVVELEAGVARCAVTGVDPDMSEYETEAEISLDDSWRMSLALCHAAGVVTSKDIATQTAIDNIIPYGPEGGVIAWVGQLLVQL